MPTSPAAVLALGFVLGLRHALDVDHLAAVSTIVSARRSLWRSSLVGAAWGLGHTASLLAVAVAVIGLRTEITPAVGRLLELGVAAMLIGLGANVLRTLARGGRLHAHLHGHGERRHAHPHLHARADFGHEHALPRRPFVVGLVHGLAGSAGLMLAVAATIPTPLLALAYLATFGIGSVGGMMIVSTLLGLPAFLAAERFAGAERALQTAAAVASVVVGLVLAWHLGLDAGFFA